MKQTRSAATRRFTAAVLTGGLVALVTFGGACGTPNGTSSDGGPAAPSSAEAACPAGMRTDPGGICVAEAPSGSAPEVSPGPTAAAASASPAARVPPGCPDVTAADRVAAFQWVKELGVEPALATRLRGTSGTAVEVRLLSTAIEAQLRAACAAMASELGSKGPFVSSQTACQAAIDGLRTTRSKLGPATKVALHVHPPLCLESIDTASDCAKRCSGDDAAPAATCAGETGGKCPGTCKGECEMRPPSPCDGACQGQCESAFTGTCAGTCRGKCDGKPLAQAGECKGKCEGGCDSAGKGECKGRCFGECQLRASECSGVCLGKCSVKEEELRCQGAVELAKAAPECAAYCAAQAIHRRVCSAAQVDARATGAKDAAAAAIYVSAVEKHLPAILSIQQQLRGRIDSLVKTKPVIAESLKAIRESGSPALPGLAACLGSYDKATSEGVATLVAASRSVAQVASTAQGK
jgi:hypothetical protein